ncbi:MAG: YgjV family protein [Treponema sp.]|nr:YgjV family protein [Treponema sp.]
MKDFFTLQNIIELVGYLGSALVIVSMLMTSVIKLRIINTAGSVIFAVYAFIIHSYPTAAMQIFLIVINVWNLYKLYNTKKEYSAVKSNWNDSFLQHFIYENKNDILNYFPNANFLFENPTDLPDFCYIVCCDSVPAGIFIGKQTQNDVKVFVDYTTPKYRDCSVGKFLYSYLSCNQNLTLKTECQNRPHQQYLKKMGFTQDGEIFTKKILSNNINIS